MLGDLGEQREVERIARLLEPAQLERCERRGIGERFVAIEFANWRRPQAASPAAIDFAPPRRRRRSSASGMPPTFIFTMRVAGVEMAAHLVLQILDGLARRSTSRRRHSRTPCRAILPPLKRSASTRCSGLSAILATASQTATSMVPMPTERSEWPPDFSFCIMTARIFSGSRLAGVVEQRRPDRP